MPARAPVSLVRVLGVLVAAGLLNARPVLAHTPTITFGPSPTATPTGTQPPPQAVITAQPNPARPEQRVVLDGTASLRASGRYEWSQVGGEPAVRIEDADQAIASFVVPPVAAPTEITVQLSLGGGVPAQQVLDLLPPETVRLEVDRVFGAPGFLVDLAVRLRPLGYAVNAIHHELRFDHFAAVAAVGSTPDCSAGQDLFVESAEFAFLPEGCTPDVDCAGVRADVVTREPIPDGAVAYRCNVVSQAQASDADCFHPLTCGAGEAQRAGGGRLAIDCRDGGVQVDAVFSPIAFAVTIEPEVAAVGDPVRITVTASGQGGLPAYSLRGVSPVLRVVSAPPPSSGPLGNAVVFETVAECPGVAWVSASVNFEARCGCSTNPFFCFTVAASRAYPVTVREAGGVVVSGHVAEFPLGCQGAMRGVTVQLDPLGWTTRTDLDGGNYSFGPVPPGDYTLSVSPPCNPFGCWSPQPILVGAEDLVQTICPEMRPPDNCPGDCDGDGVVRVNELVAAVSIALGVDDLAACPVADGTHDGQVTIDDLIRAIAAALDGCAAG